MKITRQPTEFERKLHKDSKKAHTLLSVGDFALKLLVVVAAFVTLIVFPWFFWG